VIAMRCRKWVRQLGRCFRVSVLGTEDEGVFFFFFFFSNRNDLSVVVAKSKKSISGIFDFRTVLALR